MARQSLLRGARLRGSGQRDSPEHRTIAPKRENARAARREHDATRSGACGVACKYQSNQPGSTLRKQHAAQIAEYLLGAQLLQTVQMPERTLALKTGAAFKMKPLY